MGGVAAVFVVSSLSASAASAGCRRPRTPLQQLICKDPALSSAADRVDQVLRQRLGEMPPDQRLALLWLHRRWIRFRMPFCGLSSSTSLAVLETSKARHCLLESYREHISELEATCKIDSKHNLADFLSDLQVYGRSTFVRGQVEVPHGFTIIHGLGIYRTSELHGVFSYSLPYDNPTSANSLTRRSCPGTWCRSGCSLAGLSCLVVRLPRLAG